MASRLSDRLIAAGLAPAETVRVAIARQAVYGGALDTALLEIDALAEAPLWSALSAATDLPVPDRALCESPEKVTLPVHAAAELDGAWSARCRAVPVGRKDGALQILCGEPVARAELDAASAALEALIAITKQDLGAKPKRWAAWWARHQDDDRVDWLFEGLSHKTTEIRAASEDELRALNGEYFGYHFDLPRREREAARARWQAWWSETRDRAR